MSDQVPDDEDSNDEMLALFVDQWINRNPNFRLNDSQVREQFMSLISVVMCLLSEAPDPVWQEFMRAVSEAAKKGVPLDVQSKIFARLKSASGR